MKPCWCNSSLPFVGRSWRRSPKFSYLNCAGRQQSPLFPSIAQASFNLMTTLLTAKINMISVSQPNHSYKAKEPTGLYKFQHGVIFWFEFNPRGIRNDWDYCRYLERDQGFWRPQLLLFTGRRRGSQQARAVPGICQHYLWATGGFLCAAEDKHPPAHSKFLEDTANVNRDQVLSPLSLASPKTGSAHTDMQRCRRSNVAWHCPPLGGLGICLCRASVAEQKLKDIF